MSYTDENNVNYGVDNLTGTATVSRSANASGNITILSSVTVNNVVYPVTSIGMYAFSSTNILNVIIPNSVNVISRWAFKNCTNLLSITIPNTILNIDIEIIDGCSPNLVVNYSPTISDLPDSSNVTWYDVAIKNVSNQIILDAYIAVINSTNFVKLMYLKSDTSFSSNILAQYNYDYSWFSNGHDFDLTNLLFGGLGTIIVDVPSLHNLFDNNNVTVSKWVLAGTGITYLDTNGNWIDLPTSSYPNATVSYTISPISNPACFNEGTKILCLNKELEEQYVPVETLKVGDLVKTYKHGYRRIAVIGKKLLFNNPSVFSECMYRMEKTDSNGLLEDLVVTGWHSVLVDDLGDSKEENTARLGKEKMVDDKYMLLSSVSKDFKKVETNEPFTYYHFVLESDSELQQYGIYANGVLTETQCRKDFDQKDFTLV